MSLYSAMSTSLSGMNAQASRLATVGDNVSNAGTHGYKRATTSFASMVAEQGSSGYTSGGVTSNVRYSIATQGNITFSTNASDLAVQGTGFFVVRDAMGEEFLTRAGSFQYDSLGNLTNGAFGLLGDSLETGQRGTIQVDFSRIDAAPSVNGRVSGNLNVQAPTVTTTVSGNPPSANNINPSYSHYTRMSDPAGTADIYYTKTGANQWEVTAYFDPTNTATGFPYDMTQPDLVKMSTTLTFDPVTGAITGGNTTLQPDQADPFTIDLSQFTQMPAGGAPTTKFNGTINFPSDFPTINPATEYPASANLNTGTGPSIYAFQRLDGFAGLSAGLEVDVYYSKTGPNQWEVAVFDRSLSTTGGFPYGAAGSPPLSTTTLTFDPATHLLTSPGLINVNLPSGDVLNLDFSTSQSWDDLAAPFDDKFSAAMNLNPATATRVPTYVNPTPALNLENSVYTSKTSIVGYNGTGGTEILDVYYTKTPDHKWEVAVFSQADASANGFPYSSPALASGQIEFDAVTGRALGPLNLAVQVPNGEVMNIDFSNTSQLAYEFNITDAKVDGRKASTIKEFIFGNDGTLSAVYNNGHIEATHRLVLASVTSPDKLSVLNDTLYQPNGDSGAVSYGYPTEDFYGRLMSGALEGSNVDIADEFTNMIETQRVYAANSKTFQTSAEMLEILTNMKR